MTSAREGDLDGSALSIAVIVSRFNEFVTGKLLAGAEEAAERCDLAGREVFWVPGSFEIPVVAKRLAESGRYDAVVCLGAVIRHETDHYEHVSRAAVEGIGRAALDTGVPCIFGVLTCDTDEQALERAGGERGNNGYEAMETAVRVANLLRALPGD